MYMKVCPFGAKVKPNNNQYWEQVKALKSQQAYININSHQLQDLLSKGHAVILASYPKGCNEIKLEGIETKVKTRLLALDIDSKENPITKEEMIDKLKEELGVYPIISYNTFSDTNNTKFRLIYVLGKEINSVEFKKLYKALLSKYEKWLDCQTSNLSRIWQGTNKKVNLFYTAYMPFQRELIEELINTQNELEKVVRAENFANRNITPIRFDDEVLNRIRIKGEYADQVADIITKEIDISDCLEKWFGGRLNSKGDRLVGCCPLHGGDNKSAFSIFKKTNTYSCFTRCGSGNVLTLAYRHFNTTDFNSIVIQLMREYNISIPEDAFYIIPQK